VRVGAARAHQLEDLALALRRFGQRISVVVHADELGDDGRVDRGAALCDAADGGLVQPGDAALSGQGGTASRRSPATAVYSAPDAGYP